MLFTDLIARLDAGFRRTLPGADAQARLAPVPRRQWPAGFNIARIREAAGLLLVFPKSETADEDDKEETAESAETAEKPQRKKDISLRSPHAPRFVPDREPDRGQAHIVLTVRADSLRHGGQVSLPGGVVEPGETFEQAALREAHEEIGLAPGQVRVLGALTPLDIPVSGFRLHPIVAACDTRPALSAADGEVARILEVAVDDLLDPARLRHSARERDGLALTIPAFHVADQEIWGATAMVLAEFLALLT